MNPNPLTLDDLPRSVWAVPPVARHADLSVNQAENRKLIQYLETNGVTTLLYGGNANFYHIPLSEYRATLEFLAEAAGPGSYVIPSAGPDYGRLIDQAAMLRDLPFPAVMLLPYTGPSTPAGIATGARRFAERLGRPITLYLKSEGYLDFKDVRALVDDGLVCSVKYAVTRADPTLDPYLTQLLSQVDRRYVISGMGERPAIVHLRDFGLAGFTSGAVCLAPRASTALLKAAQAGDYERAQEMWAAFMPIEDLRDSLGAIPVLHEAVTLAGMADMGAITPLLHNLDSQHHQGVQQAARDLVAFDKAL